MAGEGGLVDPRLARGCRAFLGRAGVEPVAYAWVSTDAEWIGELGLEIRPGPGEAYLWNCVTVPAHRHRGVFRAMVGGIAAVLAREGRQRLWLGSVNSRSEISLRAAGLSPALTLRVTDGRRFRTVAAEPDCGLDSRTRADALAALSFSPDALTRRLNRETRCH
jgi:hypothetical protein